MVLAHRVTKQASRRRRPRRRSRAPAALPWRRRAFRRADWRRLRCPTPTFQCPAPREDPAAVLRGQRRPLPPPRPRVPREATRYVWSTPRQALPWHRSLCMLWPEGTLLYGLSQGIVVVNAHPSSAFDSLEPELEALRKIPPVPNRAKLAQRRWCATVLTNCDSSLLMNVLFQIMPILRTHTEFKWTDLFSPGNDHRLGTNALLVQRPSRRAVANSNWHLCRI